MEGWLSLSIHTVALSLAVAAFLWRRTRLQQFDSGRSQEVAPCILQRPRCLPTPLQEDDDDIDTCHVFKSLKADDGADQQSERQCSNNTTSEPKSSRTSMPTSCSVSSEVLDAAWAEAERIALESAMAQERAQLQQQQLTAARLSLWQEDCAPPIQKREEICLSTMPTSKVFVSVPCDAAARSMATAPSFSPCDASNRSKTDEAANNRNQEVVGQWILVIDLEQMPEVNGRRGFVEAYDSSLQLFRVRVYLTDMTGGTEGNKCITVQLKLKNLLLLPNQALQPKRPPEPPKTLAVLSLPLQPCSGSSSPTTPITLWPPVVFQMMPFHWGPGPAADFEDSIASSRASVREAERADSDDEDEQADQVCCTPSTTSFCSSKQSINTPPLQIWEHPLSKPKHGMDTVYSQNINGKNGSGCKNVDQTTYRTPTSVMQSERLSENGGAYKNLKSKGFGGAAGTKQRRRQGSRSTAADVARQHPAGAAPPGVLEVAHQMHPSLRARNKVQTNYVVMD